MFHNLKYSKDFIYYPLLLLVLLWTLYLGDTQLGWGLSDWGVHPRKWIGLPGILMMPLIHSNTDMHHILNNSLPTFVLLSALIYFYHSIALKVFVLLWIATGFSVWIGAEGGVHIGMSGVIYGMSSFLFFSGVFRRYRPLMVLSLIVVFLYGSMIWGIFPLRDHISWEGHLFGMGWGIVFAYLFRKEGPQAPKYLFEVEAELGIEPPDFEGELEVEEKEKQVVYHLRE